MSYGCLECGKRVTEGFATFSIAQFGVPLCLQHQRWLLQAESRGRPALFHLYFELHARGIPAVLDVLPGTRETCIRLTGEDVYLRLDPRITFPVLREGFNVTRRDYYSHGHIPGYPVVLAERLMDRPEYTRNTVDFLISLLGLPAPLSHGRTPEFNYRPPADRIDFRTLRVEASEIRPENPSESDL